jgi:hypothetical protein
VNIKKREVDMGVYTGLLLVCATWAVTASLLMVRELERRGLPVNVVWLRLSLLQHLHQYRRITRQETGHTGPLFYHYTIPLNVALLATVAMVVVLGF